MTQWYYARGGQQSGPVTFEELRALAQSGQIDAKDLVWNAGMADWLPAGTVSGIISGGAVSSNPYAAPGSSYVPAALVTEGVEIEPGSEPIAVMECINRGFQLTKRHFGVIILTGLVYLAVAFAVEIPLSLIDVATGASPKMTELPSPNPHDSRYMMPNAGFHPSQVVHQIVTQVVGLFLSLGLTRIGLNLVSGREASVGQLFSQGNKLLRMIGASIIFYVAFFLGLILLIVPGVYIALRFGQYPIAIVDRDMGIIESFKYSSRITTNNRANLLGLILMNVLIVIAGIIALCVGVIFAIPVAWLASMVAYRWMQYGRAALADQPVAPVSLQG